MEFDLIYISTETELAYHKTNICEIAEYFGHVKLDIVMNLENCWAYENPRKFELLFGSFGEEVVRRSAFLSPAEVKWKSLKNLMTTSTGKSGVRMILGA